MHQEGFDCKQRNILSKMQLPLVQSFRFLFRESNGEGSKVSPTMQLSNSFFVLFGLLLGFASGLENICVVLTAYLHTFSAHRLHELNWFSEASWNAAQHAQGAGEHMASAVLFNACATFLAAKPNQDMAVLNTQKVLFG